MPTSGRAVISPAADIARQNDIEGRGDVLVYTTRSLNQDVDVTGPISLILYVSTTATNTDFTAKLVDVHQAAPLSMSLNGFLQRSYQEVQGPSAPKESMKSISIFGHQHGVLQGTSNKAGGLKQ